MTQLDHDNNYDAPALVKAIETANDIRDALIKALLVTYTGPQADLVERCRDLQLEARFHKQFPDVFVDLSKFRRTIIKKNPLMKWVSDDTLSL